jgi:hypothetical protein
LILRDHKPNADYADLPIATRTDVRMGNGLVIAYSLLRGVHDEAATIRGYLWDVDHFGLVATAGGDFAEYFMHDAVLKAPVTDEV